jgi:Ase1/PRC1/MAP65 family protein
MLQILLNATGAADKENRRGTKARAGSVPPRATTPNSAPGKGVVTPAVRPASSMGRAHSVPSKRPRLAETNNNGPQVAAAVPGFVPRCASSSDRPPSKIAMPVPVRASVLPLPAPRAVSATVVPKQHVALGIGRPPSRGPMTSGGVGAATHHHHLSSSSNSYRVRSVGSGLGTTTSRNPQTVALKAKRARRESFRPRPSGDWQSAAPQGRYGGGVDEHALIKEEDEDT